MLNERCRTTHVARRRQRGGPAGLGDDRRIYAAEQSWPVGRGGTRVDKGDADAVHGEGFQLLAVPYAVRAAHRVHQPKRCGAACRNARPDHRHQWHDARAAGDELDRLGQLLVPDEPSANRSAQLHEIADREILRQIGRDLAVRKSFDREFDAPVHARRRSDRIFPHGRTAVGGREA